MRGKAWRDAMLHYILITRRGGLGLTEYVKEEKENFVNMWRRRRKPSDGEDAVPPSLGQLLICLFVPLNRQEDRLADFEEKFNTLWLPRFGRRLARIIYVIHAVRSGVAVLRIMAITAVVDRVMRVFGG